MKNNHYIMQIASILKILCYDTVSVVEQLSNAISDNIFFHLLNLYNEQHTIY